MCGRLLRPATLLLSLAAFLSAHAQTETGIQDSCEVIIPKEYREAQRAKARRVPSHFTTPSTESVIKNTGRVYTFRLAACILPEFVNNSDEGFGSYSNPKSREEIIKEVQAWWDKLEKGLNEFYTNDVGIKFEVVRNPKLILFGYDVNGMQLSTNATDETRLYLSRQIIDKALGTDSASYDLGILISRPNKSRNGVAQLGSATSTTLKGSAWAISNITTIAHEIGHSFGAEHTHQKDDAICTEPGSGRSIMSYGSPRDFFSLPSIYQMRSTLANMNYYTDRERKQLVTVFPGNVTVAPYAEDETSTAPKLDRSRIKTEYTITKGSDFQFSLPTTTKNNGGYYYNVNSFDISKHDMAHSNTLRPSYKETQDSIIIFRPHCNAPTGTTTSSNYLEEYSDYSNVGTYTFMAAVHDKSQYDAMRIKVNVVDGEPFEITNVNMRNLPNYNIGREITFTWTPCTQIYGKDSKVRILFSDDYGKTFKYVLADNVPNNGSYKLIMPYLTVDNVNYESWPNFTTGGGRFMLEVEGEIACSIYPRYDYTVQQTGSAIGSGLKFDPNGQRALFKTTDGTDLPTPYIEVKNTSDIPPMTEKLTAYLKTNTSTATLCTGKETREGSLIRRAWSGNVNGINYTYTQLIRLPETVTQQELVRYQAQELATMARTLYDNMGSIGYPDDGLAEAGAFRTAYGKVFNGGDIISTTTATEVDELKRTMTALTQIGDDKVVKPEDGKYYQVRSYLSPYNRDTYYYMVDDGHGEKLVSGANFSLYTDEEQQAALWRCSVKDGKYHFTSLKGNALFSPDVPEGESLDNSLSDFRNFSNPGTDRTLGRGYSWGALTILNNQGFGCMVGLNGYFSVVRGVSNGPMTTDQRCNCNDGMIVSTDFQFVPVSNMPSGISAVTEDEPTRARGIYTIDGRKIEAGRSLQKGLYIIDGKKVVIK